jgi:hypothetical protein
MLVIDSWVLKKKQITFLRQKKYSSRDRTIDIQEPHVQNMPILYLRMSIHTELPIFSELMLTGAVPVLFSWPQQNCSSFYLAPQPLLSSKKKHVLHQPQLNYECRVLSTVAQPYPWVHGSHDQPNPTLDA